MSGTEKKARSVQSVLSRWYFSGSLDVVIVPVPRDKICKSCFYGR